MNLELVPIKIENGEEKAWQKVCKLPSLDVCKRTGSIFDINKGCYILNSFGQEFMINPCEMLIKAVDNCPHGEIFLVRLKDFFRISVLSYMSSAQNIGLSGRLLRPIDLKGGHRFSTGTHVLPLEMIAQKYNKNRDGFVDRGLQYGAIEIKGYGDAYIRLFPFSRVPVDLILWLEDEEFPAKVDLFFDSTCELQISLSDVIWAIAMMCCVIMID
ncbi:MAG TPA: DUF3786 domain-containing protein [Nitrospirae bacterium]|nr:DUF3786 domain-containing protein [Nitrospirota bacterium]